jgi:hypothetical protein
MKRVTLPKRGAFAGSRQNRRGLLPAPYRVASARAALALELRGDGSYSPEYSYLRIRGSDPRIDCAGPPPKLNTNKQHRIVTFDPPRLIGPYGLPLSAKI